MLKKIFFIVFFFFFSNPNLFAVDEISLKEQNWTFDGVFGRYDKETLQRGLQV